jgi:hypothetical protein
MHGNRRRGRGAVPPVVIGVGELEEQWKPDASAGNFDVKEAQQRRRQYRVERKRAASRLQ